MRRGKLAKGYQELNEFVFDMTIRLNDAIAKGASILIEGSQGIDLDLNFADFPFCTSRMCIPSQLVADAGVPMQAVSNVIGNIRTNPIRISNVSAADPNQICYSGNYWDAKEISWAEVAERADYTFEEFKRKYEFAMMTSVTKKLRRVFEFPRMRFEYCHKLIGGHLNDGMVLYSLNFINFIDRRIDDNIRTVESLMTKKVRDWINNNLYIISYNQLKFVRTGPSHSSVVEME
jgi:hypothetical protein